MLYFVSCNTPQSLKKCFPEYDGPEGESMPALKYIEQKYKQVKLTLWYVLRVLNYTQAILFLFSGLACLLCCHTW